MKNKIHPTSIINGYKMGLKEAMQFIKKNLIIKVDTIGRKAIVNAAKTSMSSKLIGPESNLFGEMVVEAMMNVKITTPSGDKYPVKSVNVIKCHGQSITQSRLINGYVLEGGRAAQGKTKANSY